jgi:hypothetical protein
MTQDGPPQLCARADRWSRKAVLDWLFDLADQQADMVIGFDFSFALPFFDAGKYFPKWEHSPDDARQLWALVDHICAADPHLEIRTLLEHTDIRRHFRHSKSDVGDLFPPGPGRFRQVEHHQRISRQANSASCFNLIGAAQVGKSSLTGMRMLHKLQGAIPVWPFDPVPDRGPVIVEIYTSLAARAAGLGHSRSKIRDHDTLEAALTKIGSPTPAVLTRYDDHSTDALLTAAWMQTAVLDNRLWQPEPLTRQIAEKEGWTFGIF